MTLSSLLVCLDDADARVLGKVLEELDIRCESCPDLARAEMRLAQQSFDAVILDCASQSDATALLRETRLSCLNDSTLAVVVVQDQEGVHEMFSMGVNFVLYKPVSHERALSSLRAARAVMQKEKRRSERAPVHAQATVDYANVEQEKATLIDLAEEGMSVQFGKKLPPTSKVYFQFQLPDQVSSVRLSGQVLWQEWNGRAGIQFVDVPKFSRRLLTDFLKAHVASASRKGAVSAVTVEMEEPLQAVGVGAASEGKAREKVVGGEASAHVTADSGDRRNQTRHACRLGAEVYRTGITVPNHCSLTDLSPGGCYLEVHLPFPKGTSVEIIVRTYNLKLRLRGRIQTSHPGYGMGVAFELETEDECEQVQKLLDFVAATMKSE
jgi:DNA-binding response OmpR family regulator